MQLLVVVHCCHWGWTTPPLLTLFVPNILYMVWAARHSSRVATFMAAICDFCPYQCFIGVCVECVCFSHWVGSRHSVHLSSIATLPYWTCNLCLLRSKNIQHGLSGLSRMWLVALNDYVMFISCRWCRTIVLILCVRCIVYEPSTWNWVHDESIMWFKDFKKLLSVLNLLTGRSGLHRFWSPISSQYV